jgi:pimeloyl-ACP methyl ester carboxylesterase
MAFREQASVSAPVLEIGYEAAGERRPDSVPVILVSEADGVAGPSGAEDAGFFTGPCEIRSLPGIGHSVPQEAPAAFAEAVLSLPRT